MAAVLLAPWVPARRAPWRAAERGDAARPRDRQRCAPRRAFPALDGVAPVHVDRGERLPRLTAPGHRHAARAGACSASASRGAPSPAAPSPSSACSSPCAADLRLDSRAFGGDLLAIGGAVCLAGYLLIGRSVRTDLGVAGYSAIVYAVVCVIAAATAVAGGVAHLPSPRVALACARARRSSAPSGATPSTTGRSAMSRCCSSRSRSSANRRSPRSSRFVILGAIPTVATDRAAACSSSPGSRSRSSNPGRAPGRAAAHRDRTSDGPHRVRPSGGRGSPALRRERPGVR